jgi:imidazole glycerol phosphate synthase glutamine amidotransferase subunit
VNVTLLDYGAGNVVSVQRALRRLDVESERATTPAEIAAASVLVLPGVGHYAALIRALDEQSLRQPLLDKINSGTPFLGICLGLQALFESSEEARDLPGLQLIPGSVTMLPASGKLPHMGWNTITPRCESRLLEGVSQNDYFYFAHSYAVAMSAGGNAGDVVATCHHAAEFVAILEHENIFGVQFHPEKSGASGARLLANFLRLAA